MNYYLTVRLHGGAGHRPQHLVPKLVGILHYQIRNGDAPIALALPKCEAGDRPRLGWQVRFFSDNSKALDELADRIEERRELADLLTVSRVKEAPGVPTSWQAFTRCRLPSRHRGNKDHDKFYRHKMQKRAQKVAEISRLPVIFVRSKKQPDCTFGLGVKMIRSEEYSGDMGKLNGYGLSSEASPVWLPAI